MNLEQLENKKVAILGLGMEGVALARFLRTRVKKISLLDKLSIDELGDRAKEENNIELANILNNSNFSFVLGKNYLDGLDKFDVIFRSPGISYLHNKIQEAKGAGVIISSQIKLFFELCPCPIIGVTGTKGKGTTASLIFEMLNKSTKHEARSTKQIQNTNLKNSKHVSNFDIRISDFKPKVYLAGNIGEPAIDLIGKLTKDDLAILELSSFQLQDMEKSPRIAVVLNISSDHLDYHQTESEYFQAKLNIVKHQNKNDYAVINQDYLTSYQFSVETASEVYYFSGEESVDQGSFVRQSQTSNLKSQTLGVKKELYEIVLRMDDKEEIICRSDEIQLIGKHNLENIAAASVAAHLAGADINSISKTAKSFTSLPHRLEFIKEIGGVKFYNDSYATNPEPTVAAVNSFDKPIHIILGGSSKGADFSKLSDKIAQSKIKSVFLIGDEKDNMLASLKKSNYSGKVILSNGDFDQIIKEVLLISEPEDVVLLSPACASFGLFKNYKDRGEKFRKAVLRYKP